MELKRKMYFASQGREMSSQEQLPIPDQALPIYKESWQTFCELMDNYYDQIHTNPQGLITRRLKEEFPDAESSSSALSEDSLPQAKNRGKQSKAAFNPGGIDLNPKNLDIKVEGEGITIPQLDIPFDINNFQGFSFKIIKIERINKWADKKGGESEFALSN